MRHFKIKKGKHSSGLHFKPIFCNKLSFCAEFSHECLYDFPGDDPDQEDINKLLGFSRGFHHKNSARIGWRSKNNKIELLAYCYVNSKRIISDVILTIEPEEKVCCTIKDTGLNWFFKIQTANSTQKINIPKESSSCCGYVLFPYFGGNEVAPHDMEIKVEIQK